MTQAWLGARARPRETHLSTRQDPVPHAQPAALLFTLAPLRIQEPSPSAPPPQPHHTQLRDGFVAKYFIAAIPMVEHWEL